MQPKYYLFALLTLTSLTLNACSSDQEGEGTIELTIYGEEHIEKGIPQSDDGWSLTFSKFELKIQNVRFHVTPENGVEILPHDQGGKIVDLSTETNKKGQVVETINLPVGKYYLTFDISDFVIQGSAKKGNVTKNFDWHIDKLVSYEYCPGRLSIEKGKKSTYPIIIQGKRLFQDAVYTDNSGPNTKFDAIAEADTNHDDKISIEELEAASLNHDYWISYEKNEPKNFLEYITYRIKHSGHTQFIYLGNTENGECKLKKDLEIKAL